MAELINGIGVERSELMTNDDRIDLVKDFLNCVDEDDLGDEDVPYLMVMGMMTMIMEGLSKEEAVGFYLKSMECPNDEDLKMVGDVIYEAALKSMKPVKMVIDRNLQLVEDSLDD